MSRTLRHGAYEVTGPSAYRGHQQGETFTALLNPQAERRAIERGAIRLIGRVTPGLQPGSYEFPPGWLAGHNTPPPEAAKAASLIRREK